MTQYCSGSEEGSVDQKNVTTISRADPHRGQVFLGTEHSMLLPGMDVITPVCNVLDWQVKWAERAWAGPGEAGVNLWTSPCVPSECVSGPQLCRSSVISYGGAHPTAALRPPQPPLLPHRLS
jgi:hypothetical protein